MTLIRITIFQFCLIYFAAGLAFANEPAEASRPNIIFLFADDQRADTIAAHGNPHIQTPNLDRLSREGFSFRRNYCAGSFSGAVCVASRAMLMTGRHWMSLPRKKPAQDWPSEDVLPRLLTESGYNSFIVGKWHNGKKTLLNAFSEGGSVYMGGMANHADFSVQDLKAGTLTAKRVAEKFSSEQFADEAIKFIGSASKEQPYFLYVAMMAPHDPRNPPEKYRELYYNKRPPLPENFMGQHPFFNGSNSMMNRDEGLAPWPRPKEMISDQLCEYYGLVTHLDEQVGRILGALDKSGQASNTIVVYTADHGLAMGSHGLLGKQNLYEQSMRCPLMLRGPGISKGGSSESLTYIHDLYSTVCELAEVEKPGGPDSQSLLPLIKGTKDKIHDSIFLPYQDSQRSVTDGRWKLHVYPKVNHHLLFDLDKDPHELNNLAEDASQKERLKEMLGLMESWRKELQDPNPLSVEKPLSLETKFESGKRVLDVWQPKWIRDKYFDGRERTNHGKKR